MRQRPILGISVTSLCLTIAGLAPAQAKATIVSAQPGDLLTLVQPNGDAENVYVNASNGDALGTEILTDANFPEDLAVTSSQTLWIPSFASSCVGGGPSGFDNALDRYETSTDSEAPGFAITGADTGLSCPTSIATSGTNKTLFVLNDSPPSIRSYDPSGAADQSPLSTISGSKTGVAGAGFITESPDGRDLYVDLNSGLSEPNGGAIEEIPTSANGNVKPVRVISGPKTGLGRGPVSIAVGLDGTVYAVAAGNFLTFSPGAHGDAVPESALTASPGPDDVTLSATGTVYLTAGLQVDTVSNPTTHPTAHLLASYPDPVAVTRVLGDVPDAVTKLNVTAGDRSAALSWAAPANQPIGYYVSVSSKVTGPFRPVSFLSSKAAIVKTTVRGLPAGRPAYFEVLAGNDTGLASAESFVNSATPYGPPSAPKDVTLTRKHHALTAKWKAPASTGGKPITGYVVAYGTCKPTRSSCHAATAKAGPHDRSAKLQHIKTGKTYYVEVTAKNSAGAGSPSAIVHKTS